MKSNDSTARDRKLTLNRESLRRLQPAELRQVEGGVVQTNTPGGPCELISLALSCEIIRCF